MRLGKLFLHESYAHFLETAYDETVNYRNIKLKKISVIPIHILSPHRCGHCKSLAPEYEKAASVLAGVVKVVAVDATVAQSLQAKYQVQGFPTLKVTHVHIAVHWYFCKDNFVS